MIGLALILALVAGPPAVEGPTSTGKIELDCTTTDEGQPWSYFFSIEASANHFSGRRNTVPIEGDAHVTNDMITLRIVHSAGDFAETFNIDRNTGNVVVEFGSSQNPAASASERGTCQRHTGRAF